MSNTQEHLGVHNHSLVIRILNLKDEGSVKRLQPNRSSFKIQVLSGTPFIYAGICEEIKGILTFWLCTSTQKTNHTHFVYFTGVL